MPIKLTKEPAEYATLGMEKCCFCNNRTSYWYPRKDVPVCPNCATKVRPNDVPSKTQWIKNGPVGVPLTKQEKVELAVTKLKALDASWGTPFPALREEIQNILILLGYQI